MANISGTTVNDVLSGTEDNDLLDGKAGADTMAGGAGNDTYIVDNAGDIVQEPGEDLSGAGSVVRISTMADGSQISKGVSSVGQLSADGRYLLFRSWADNLVAGDTNKTQDYFVKDLQTGGITRVNTAADGSQTAGGWPSYGQFSPDGRYVLFSSPANNLVAGDTNNAIDIFIKDLQTGAISRINTAADGTQANNPAFDGRFSPDGHYVLFESWANNLVEGDTNNRTDIFIKDLQSGAISRISTAADGSQANDHASGAQFSADGRRVMFVSAAGNLVTDDYNQQEDIFIKDLQSGAVKRIAAGEADRLLNSYLTNSQLSANGRYVAFNSFAGSLVAGDSNYAVDVFVADTQTGSVVRVSTAADGAEANGFSWVSAISADGRYVIFGSDADNLVVGDTNAASDVFIKDLKTGAIARVNTGAAGEQVHAGVFYASFSPDGQHVVVSTTADNLVTGDTNNSTDVFIKDISSFFAGAEGIDTVCSSISYTLGVGLENLVLTGNQSRNGTGNGKTNILTGNSADNVLDGAAAADTLIGGLGNDTYVIDNRGDRVQESSTVVTELDTVCSSIAYTLGNNLENLTLTGTAAIKAMGNALANVLAGNNAANVLNGARGEDTLKGGLGNDTYVVDNAADVIQEGGTMDVEVDTVLSSVTWTLGVNLESLVLTGATAINGIGNGLSNRLTGNSAANLLDGKAGIDTMRGGAGDDTYIVDSTGEVVNETGTGVMALGAVTRVSVGADGEGHGYSLTPGASANGRFVVFASTADNLVAGDGNELPDIFVKDLKTGITRRANTAADGSEAHGFSHTPVMSADGRYVLFVSDAPNLVANDNNGMPDVFVKDLQTGSITRVNTTADGSEGEGGSGYYDANLQASFSADGRYVAFWSKDRLLVDGDDNQMEDLFVKDLQTGAISRVNTSPNGAEVHHDLSELSPYYGTGLSANGRYLVYAGRDYDLVLRNAVSLSEVFVRDLQTGIVQRVSVPADGELAHADSLRPSISANGQMVAFESFAANLVAGDSNNAVDIFVRNMQTGTLRRASTAADGSQANGYSSQAVISADGRYVAFMSHATNLLAGGNQAGIFIKDLRSGAIARVAGDVDGGFTFSADSRHLVFASADNSLVAGDTNNLPDVFIQDIFTAPTDAGGVDTVQASISYTLSNYVENLVLTGTAAINGSGNALSNKLTGNAAANRLDGGAGVDTLIGGGGNDTYIVDAGDTILEKLAEGVDLVMTGGNYTLGSYTENLVLTGTAASKGTGNSLANSLTGNDAANVLSGGAGADSLDGRAGADTLLGGTGNDTYLMARGGEVDTVVENDSTAGNTDVLSFLSGVAHDQLWFKHVGNNLEVSIIGTADKVVIRDWYTGTNQHIEQIRTVTGNKTLLDSKVENLVTAMSTMTPPPLGQTNLTTAQHAQLESVIAANWS